MEGRLETLRWNMTPSPLGIETVWREPLILPPLGKAFLLKALSGRVATKATPAGLLVMAVAFPRD